VLREPRGENSNEKEEEEGDDSTKRKRIGETQSFLRSKENERKNALDIGSNRRRRKREERKVN